ncbi:diaminopimelate decarboxylase [Chloroflexota bacterium]
MSQLKEKLALLPNTAALNGQGHLTVGGCDTVELASEFGTPLYVLDEATLRQMCAEYRQEFRQRYTDTLVLYAAKAFLCRAMASIVKEEGLGLDVVSGGEIAIARSVDFPMDKVYLHGNNKLREEIELAVNSGVGRIVVDNLYELSLLNDIAREAGVTQSILLRLTPGIDPHTHRYIATGNIDSKFGLSIASGQAEEAVVKAVAAPNVNLVGLHMHIGSLISTPKPYLEAIKVVFQFAAGMRDKHGFAFGEFNCGGGYAVQYTQDVPAIATSEFAEAITAAVLDETREKGFALPRLLVEPGRAIVGRAGLALYKVGAIKDIPGVRRYVSVDGGMADNIRPALYGSGYEAIVANKVEEDEVEQVTIAGKFCESGDILIRDIRLPELVAGDIIAVPVSGAYSLSLASNYNASLKPAIVLVSEGKVRLIRRRETYEDLMRCDLP